MHRQKVLFSENSFYIHVYIYIIFRVFFLNAFFELLSLLGRGISVSSIHTLFYTTVFYKAAETNNSKLRLDGQCTCVDIILVLVENIRWTPTTRGNGSPKTGWLHIVWRFYADCSQCAAPPLTTVAEQEHCVIMFSDILTWCAQIKGDWLYLLKGRVLQKQLWTSFCCGTPPVDVLLMLLILQEFIACTRMHGQTCLW